MSAEFDRPYSLNTLIGIMDRLRDPERGCPWDLEQTFETIVPHTLEEAYEVADAIERGDLDALPDELGDLLFQVVFYSRLAGERDLFDCATVIDRICDKLIRRHPHVFGDAEHRSASDQSRAWEAQKARERAANGQAPHRNLADVPVALPALARAAKLQRRAARVGFDWPAVAPALDKIGEETGELRESIDAGSSPKEIEHELGDLLFSVVNVARHLDIDPEQALRGANRRFTGRFQYIEDRLAEQGRSPEDVDLETLDRLWDEAKGGG